MLSASNIIQNVSAFCEQIPEDPDTMPAHIHTFLYIASVMHLIIIFFFTVMNWFGPTRVLDLGNMYPSPHVLPDPINHTFLQFCTIYASFPQWLWTWFKVFCALGYVFTA